MAEPILRVEQLAKRYPTGTAALADVTFSAGPGELLAVVGHNGAGKSTLLNIVSGLINATSGRVVWADPGARVMWAPQRTTVDWSLTVRQNVDLVARLTRTPSRRVDEVLELLDLGGVGAQQAEYISGGQLQRVQIARALVAEAPVYVLDEPAAGLDPQAADIVMTYLRERARDGRTVIVSSHDLDAVERTADTLVLLDGGRVQAHLPVTEFVRRAGARLQVQVALAEAVPGPVVARLHDTLPEGWQLEAAPELTSLIVHAPLATGLHRVLAWLPADLQVSDLSSDHESLRDVYLARYRRTGDAVAEVVSS